jgi:hypothetical protein
MDGGRRHCRLPLTADDICHRVEASAAERAAGLAERLRGRDVVS